MFSKLTSFLSNPINENLSDLAGGEELCLVEEVPGWIRNVSLLIHVGVERHVVVRGIHHQLLVIADVEVACNTHHQTVTSTNVCVY